ncbi:hypothetical protein H310_06295 [Aphanomyces invadans]|uniref:Steroid 5-alpha reductase C-terminal domain-containing protein n=1 Tax=Aphanomyces invadans TaxID=157072 RepID=A0A024U5X6_9STRA|nr:hypothetical protein H310_06295 [Aphanomyces invadans]ETW01674.1 hypothetical protein H310_06295 [Aphanomyces invadans]|eukprot:XP_008869522.1 hypothetical protein H310_06295 [Aphanomyces invadans]
MYIACGACSMLVWVLRNHMTKDDHRWELHWRTIWRLPAGGFFGSSSIQFNFFCFYHCPTTITPPSLATREYVGEWLFGFAFENIAAIHRHPNYFGDLCVWVMSFADACAFQRGLLAMLPGVACYYLVYFTGAWMAEQVSLMKRGRSHAHYYQAETSILIP